MDFFERQDQARRNTKLLVTYFILAVVLIIAAVYLAMAALFLRARYEPGTFAWLWHAELFWSVTLGTLAIILGGTLYKISEVSGGGGAVAKMLGGRALNANTQDEHERKLLNVVEEMSIASGTPVPEVYVLEREESINAFAAGHTTNDAAIGVTRGCMRLLNRDELQGVIGHEFSHILNGDMRLNVRLIGIVHGILCLAILGRILLRTGGSSSSSGNRKGGNPLPIIGLALLLTGWIGVFFGRLIKSAVSRQREFLADAAAVQFTRNPGGLSGALKKIGGYTFGSRLLTPHAEEGSHLYIGNGLGEAWFGLMATHPPLHERIRAIDPTFDGHYPQVLSERAEVRQKLAAEAGIPVATQVAREITGMGLAEMRAQHVDASTVVPRVGTTTPKHLEYATHLHAAIPESIAQTLHDPTGAVATVLGLVLSTDATVQQVQRQIIEQMFDAAMVGRVVESSAFICKQDPTIKLPLLTLTLSALRRLPAEDYERFERCVRTVAEADCEIDLFEYTVLKTLVRHLEPQFKPRQREIVQFYSLTPLLSDCAVLLSALAHSGHTENSEVVKAFAAGVPYLRHGVTGLKMLQAADCGLGPVDEALRRLAQAVPQIKKNVLEACAHTVAADGMIQPHEAELLRAIADALDCPIPPFVKGV
jgi:Zn-dependent protease with chaperone function/tellurite resistance protein